MERSCKTGSAVEEMDGKSVVVEEWRPVVGFGREYYEVSSEGRYRSLDRYVSNNWHNGLKLMRGRIMKLYKRGKYWFASITVDGEQKSVYIHRLVARAFPDVCGEWFEGCDVDHIDCNIDNNRAENLRVCTTKENQNNPKTRKHLSSARKKWHSENKHPLLGTHLSEDTKSKISAKAKERYKNNRTE